MDYPSGVKVYDAYSPVARQIYWDHLKRLFDYGIDAWWMDSTDPDFFNPRESDYDYKTTMGSWRSVRNLFPLATVKGIYANQRKASADKRVFIMTRSAFAGQQHYGAGLWSGDVASTWDMLRKQVPAGLNYTMTGCPINFWMRLAVCNLISRDNGIEIGRFFARFDEVVANGICHV